MFHNLNIKDIIFDGYKSIKGDSNYFLFILIYILLPLFGAAFMSYNGYYVSSDVTSDIIGGIGLFAGLMFTLLFIVTSNYKNRKEQLCNKQDDEVLNYIERYRRFTEDAVSLISYSIVKAGIIIITTIVYTSVLPINGSGESHCIFAQIFNGLLVVLLFQFMVIITRILKEMYAMLFDDINK